MDILIPQEYPFEPPKMKFITKIWHPNVSSQTGAICLVSSASSVNIFIMFIAMCHLITVPIMSNICFFCLTVPCDE